MLVIAGHCVAQGFHVNSASKRRFEGSKPRVHRAVQVDVKACVGEDATRGIATRCKAEGPNRTPFMASPAGRARRGPQRRQERLAETDAFELPTIVVEEAERPVFERVLDRAVNGHVRNFPACDIAGDEKPASVAFNPVTLKTRCAETQRQRRHGGGTTADNNGRLGDRARAMCRFFESAGFPAAVYLAPPRARWLASTASSQRVCILALGAVAFIACP